MDKRPVSVLAGLHVGLLCGQALAHHSVSTNYLSYDEDPVVLQDAVIKHLEIRNPHSLITVDAPAEDGEMIEWLIEWSDGNALRRRAVPVDRLSEGEVVTIYALRHRLVDHVGFANTIVLADGTRLRDCGDGTYRSDEFYAACEEAGPGETGSAE